MLNLFDPDCLMKNDLVSIGSPDTVAEKIRAIPALADDGPV